MKRFDRRYLLGAGAAAALAGTWLATRSGWNPEDAVPEPPVRPDGMGMPLRDFGRTGLKVSEVGFGAWAIGGQSYGRTERQESLAALARAEELGCNIVDTAAVYGASEEVLGEFLAGRRDRWVICTKYSAQEAGMRATLEDQLRRLGTDRIDFYMVHWRPGPDEAELYDELAALKQEGKIRFAGVSLRDQRDIRAVLDNPVVDGFMVPLNLLQPDPFLECRTEIAAAGKAVIARSTLREGFLAGGFNKDTRFTDPADQRSELTTAQIGRLVERVEQFRFLAPRAESLARAAIGYVLSFPEVSTAVLGIKNVWEAEQNCGKAAGYRLNRDELAAILEIQREQGSLDPRSPGGRLLRKVRNRLGRS
jgi:myo-inositol catabolism protein IolS